MTKYNSGESIKKNEIGGVCGTHGGKRGMYTGFWSGILRERDLLEDVGVDGTLIL
jgi:hypothetical protein